MTTDAPSKRPYIGGYEGTLMKPRFQALYREVKSRKRAMQLIDLFWIEDLGYPSTLIISSWCKDVEDGTARVPKSIQEWIRSQIEQEESFALREMAMEYAEAGKELAKKVRDGEQVPGGVVTLKYLADGAGFVAGKRSEITQAGSPKKQGFTVGNLSISVAPPKKLKAADQIIDAEVRELPVGSPD